MATYTRAHLDKFTNVHKEIKDSICNALDELFKNAYAMRVQKNADRTSLIFDIQKEDGTIVTQAVSVSEKLYK